MRRSVAGIALAAIAMYAWGFLYWGASSLPYTPWQQTADDAAAGRALLEHFSESGVYYLPGNANPPERRARLYETGPTGFVILDVDGRPEFDPGIMAGGFALNAVVAALLGFALWLCRPAVPRYRDRLGLALLVAAIAVVFVNFGDAVWWALPWDWELAQSFYNFTALALGGAILARFVPPRG